MTIAIDDLTEAVEAHQQSDLKTAEFLYRRILETDPANTGALNLLGVLCAQTSREEEARMLLQQAVRSDPDHVASRFNLANVLNEGGQPRTAVKEYRAVLQREPEHTGAMLNLAAAQVDMDRPKAAIETYQQLLSIQPGHASARSSLASLLWAGGDRDRARSILDAPRGETPDAGLLGLRASMHFEDFEFDAAAEHWKRALDIEPDCVDHPHNLGQALRQLERHDEAAEAYARAAMLVPGESRFVRRLIESLFDAGRIEEGVLACDSLLTVDAEASLVLHQRGELLREFGRPREAAKEYQSAIRADSSDAAAWCNLSGCLSLIGESAEAIVAGERAVAIQPDLAEAHLNLAAAHLDRRELRAAIEHAQSALAIKPDLFGAHTTMAAAMRQAGKPRAAIERLRALTEIHSSSPEAWTKLGHAQREAGEFDHASQSYDRALQLVPTYPGAEVGVIKIQFAKVGPESCVKPIEQLLGPGRVHPYITTTAAEVFIQTGRAEQVVQLLEPIAGDESQPAGDRRTISMRLGEAHDRLGEYDRAFHWYARGNQILDNVYDELATRSALANLIDVFDSDWPDRMLPGGDGSFAPIFIAGMPRSGTTLVEQILASHSRVAGVGEIGLAAEAAASIGRIEGTTLRYPESARDIEPARAHELAAWCIDQLRSHAGEVERIVEKSPTNSLHLPLLAAIFPNARFIWCQRDPMDTCLSCYFHDFVGHYPYSYDLEHLGRYHTMHTQLMESWQDLLGDRILPVGYENVVNDLEGETRRLLEFCDLDWDPACLDFHKTDRTVLTASRDQVRTPLYSSSIGRARKYERHLEPLRRALAERINSGTNST